MTSQERAQELELFNAYSQGDKKAGQKLIELNFPVVNKQARLLHKQFPFVAEKELRQIGYLCLCEKLPKWNPHKGAYSFGMYCYRSVRTKMLDAIAKAQSVAPGCRRRNWPLQTRPLDRVLNLDEGNWQTINTYPNLWQPNDK
jgi:DNA-directed RNA polymerase specialized sigma subunit